MKLTKMQWLLLSNGFANKHISILTRGYNNGKWCVLCGPCPVLISRASPEMEVSQSRVAVADVQRNSGTWRRRNVCHWKPIPEDW
jgi:hypothetical protein